MIGSLARSERLYETLRQLRVLARYAARRPHEQDFAAFGLFRDRPGIFLDVGANAGQSALSFRLYDRETPILSIEPNPYVAKRLKLVGRLAGKLTYVQCAAGDREGTAVLYVPTYRRAALTGEASLDREAAERSLAAWRSRDPEHCAITTATVAVRPLDDLAVQPAFVKIDVQGHELQALLGLRETIARHHPVIMVEKNPTNADRVTDLLQPFGYEACVFDPGQQRFEPYRDQARLNVFYLPQDSHHLIADGRPAAAST